MQTRRVSSFVLLLSNYVFLNRWAPTHRSVREYPDNNVACLSPVHTSESIPKKSLSVGSLVFVGISPRDDLNPHHPCSLYLLHTYIPILCDIGNSRRWKVGDRSDDRSFSLDPGWFCRDTYCLQSQNCLKP